MRFEGGARGVVTLSQVSAGRKNHLHWEIDGSQPSAAWRAERPEELWLGHRERRRARCCAIPASSRPTPPRTRACPPATPRASARRSASSTAPSTRAVAAGGPPDEPDYPTFAAGHEQALIGDAIARSHAEGRWVAVAR